MRSGGGTRLAVAIAVEAMNPHRAHAEDLCMRLLALLALVFLVAALASPALADSERADPREPTGAVVTVAPASDSVAGKLPLDRRHRWRRGRTGRWW